MNDDFNNELTDDSKQEETTALKMVYQCKSCLSIYDEAYGDELNNITVGVSFENLPPDYCCPICENGKVNFVLTNI
ncbi:Rubredoxin-2 [compost metagenome]